VWLTEEAVHYGQGRPGQDRRALVGYGPGTVRSSSVALSRFFEWLDINHYLPIELSAADARAILAISTGRRQVHDRPDPIREAVPLVVAYYVRLPLPSILGTYDRLIRQALSILRNRALTSVLFSTGLRAQELAGLKRSDWDRDKALMCVVGKSEWSRTVGLGPEVGVHLARYLQAREEYFTSSQSSAHEPLFARHDPTAQPATSLMPITTKTVWQVVAQAVEGLKQQGYPIDGSVSPQDFRRFLAATDRPTLPGAVEQATRKATRK
jgi:integrase